MYVAKIGKLYFKEANLLRTTFTLTSNINNAMFINKVTYSDFERRYQLREQGFKFYKVSESEVSDIDTASK